MVISQQNFVEAAVNNGTFKFPLTEESYPLLSSSYPARDVNAAMRRKYGLDAGRRALAVTLLFQASVLDALDHFIKNDVRHSEPFETYSEFYLPKTFSYIVTSGYRYNAATPGSAHNFGLALDFHWNGLPDHPEIITSTRISDREKKESLKSTCGKFISSLIASTNIVPDQVLLGVRHLHVGFGRPDDCAVSARAAQTLDSVTILSGSLSCSSSCRAGHESGVYGMFLPDVFTLSPQLRIVRGARWTWLYDSEHLRADYPGYFNNSNLNSSLDEI